MRCIGVALPVRAIDPPAVAGRWGPPLFGYAVRTVIPPACMLMVTPLCGVCGLAGARTLQLPGLP